MLFFILKQIQHVASLSLCFKFIFTKIVNNADWEEVADRFIIELDCFKNFLENHYIDCFDSYFESINRLQIELI